MKTLSILAALLMAAPVVAEEQAQQAEEEQVLVSIENDAFIEDCKAQGGNPSVNFVVDSFDLDDIVTEGENAGKTKREVAKAAVVQQGENRVALVEALITEDMGLETPQFTSEDYELNRQLAAQFAADAVLSSELLDNVICIAEVAEGNQHIGLVLRIKEGIPEANWEAVYEEEVAKYLFAEASASTSVCANLASFVASEQIDVKYQYMCSDDTGIISLSQAAEFKPLSEVEQEQAVEQVTP